MDGPPAAPLPIACINCVQPALWPVGDSVALVFVTVVIYSVFIISQRSVSTELHVTVIHYWHGYTRIGILEGAFPEVFFTTSRPNFVLKV